MKPLTRRERIETLLDHWDDFYAVAGRDQSASSNGGVYLLSGMSHHPSVIELCRALQALRAFAPSKYAHLCGYYSAPYRTTERKRRIVGRKGKSGYVPERVRERVVPAWVRAQKVRDAVALVSQDAGGEARPWCFRGEPFLPKPLLEPGPQAERATVAA